MSSKFSLSRSGMGGIVPVAAGAIAMVGMALAAGNATAGTIYQDNFSGSSTLGTLNGSAPTIDNGPSAAWTAPSSSSYGWAADGDFNANTSSVGRATA